jgi:hypothetical protein
MEQLGASRRREGFEARAEPASISSKGHGTNAGPIDRPVTRCCLPVSPVA